MIRSPQLVAHGMTVPHEDLGRGVSQSAALKALAQRREEIEARLKKIEAGALSAASGIGFGKRIGEGTNIAVERLAEVSMHDGLLAELRTVLRAEEKIAGGAGATCDSCGNEIGLERLEAIPWATHCVECAV